MTLLQLALVVALVIQFINALFWEGMILFPLAQKLWSLSSWIKKPLFDCPICMSPWWGSLILWAFLQTGYLDHLTVTSWFITLALVGGINVLIVRFTNFE